MKKYKFKDVEYDLEDKDFFLIIAINELSIAINQARIQNG